MASSDTECSNDPYMEQTTDDEENVVPPDAAIRVGLQMAHRDNLIQEHQERIVMMVTDALLQDAAQELRSQVGQNSSSAWRAADADAHVQCTAAPKPLDGSCVWYPDPTQAPPEPKLPPKGSSGCRPDPTQAPPEPKLPPRARRPAEAQEGSRKKQRCERPEYSREEWQETGWFDTRREYERTVYDVIRKPCRTVFEKRRDWWRKHREEYSA